MARALPDGDRPQRDAGAAPLWEQTAALIEAEVQRRGLGPGAKLPSERELSTALDISRITLRKALGHLVDRGLVTATHGRGWFVAQPPADDRGWPSELESFTETARRKGLRAHSLVLRQEQAPADFDDADLLGVPAGAPLLHLERVRLLDGVRIAVDHTRLPADLAPTLGSVDFTDASLFEELRARGLHLDRSHAAIEARTADPRLAGELGIDPGAAVLVLRQQLYAKERTRRPSVLSTVRYSGDRYRLLTTFHQG